MPITSLFVNNLAIALLFSLMSLASAANDVEAEYHLGELYRLGNGVQINRLKAESHYINAAQRNHPLAQLNLGKMYYFGELGPAQKEKAFYWLQKSAEQNNADAQWMLGGMLFNVQDIVTAYSWLTLASEQNHVQAIVNKTQVRMELSAEQLNLADTLTVAFKRQQADKLMIRKQEEEAFYWLHKAAEQNDPHSQWMIGKMLLDGQGVSQDSIAAYSWLTLASEQDHSQATLKHIELENKLSAKQITLAGILTNDFKQQQLSIDSKQPQPKMIKPSIEHQTVESSIPQESIVMTSHYRVQVGSFKSQQVAEAVLADLTENLVSLMSNQVSTITSPKPSSNKPDFYRLQIGNFSDKQEASKLCQQFESNKQDCFIVKVNAQ